MAKSFFGKKKGGLKLFYWSKIPKNRSWYPTNFGLSLRKLLSHLHTSSHGTRWYGRIFFICSPKQFSNFIKRIVTALLCLDDAHLPEVEFRTFCEKGVYWKTGLIVYITEYIFD